MIKNKFFNLHFQTDQEVLFNPIISDVSYFLKNFTRKVKDVWRTQISLFDRINHCYLDYSPSHGNTDRKDSLQESMEFFV